MYLVVLTYAALLYIYLLGSNPRRSGQRGALVPSPEGLLADSLDMAMM